MRKLLPQNWNDTLSLILIIAIPTLWVLDGMGAIAIKPEVSGALIVSWTTVISFYYRKASSEKH
jgi:hypothetical protein